MSLLHVYFALRKQRDFQKQLELSRAASGANPASSVAAQLSSSGGRSWTKQSTLANYGQSKDTTDVNHRDAMGRTVLHCASAALDPAALEYVKLLLTHPQINVNAQDTESHWTPLHRALYAGNIQAALILLQRVDIDMFVKDYEGYTPFDVYNSTVAGTKPHGVLPNRDQGVDLFTWGSNRNAALGLGYANDRVYPEQVVLRAPEPAVQTAQKFDLDSLKPLNIRDIAMSKLHTTVLTSEMKGNIRCCGFASGGRLGPGPASASHSQYALLKPQVALPHNVSAVAVAQDHTMVVTSTGELFTWGLNRFSQLGYVIEVTGSTLKGKGAEEVFQATAKRVYGPLRNQQVIGAAACKTASACWTNKDLYTWGTNGGQLGYDKAGQVQAQPRLVPAVQESVSGVAMTEKAMLVLLQSGAVICLYEGGYWRLPPVNKQPGPRYRAPNQGTSLNRDIVKVTTCEGSGAFALLSGVGDVYLYNPDDTKKDGSKRLAPQLVWAVRKKVTAVQDVALGAEGSLILCTRSGHVFVRTRHAKGPTINGPGASSFSLVTPPTKSAPSFKFQRVNFLQRVVKVCANSTGAFAVLRLDAEVKPVKIVGNSIEQDLAEIQPFMVPVRKNLAEDRWLPHDSAMANEPDDAIEVVEQSASLLKRDEDDEDTEDQAIADDIRSAMDVCRLVKWLKTEQPQHISARYLKAHGADCHVSVENTLIPVHRSILAARSSAFRELFSGVRKSNKSKPSTISQSSTIITFRSTPSQSLLQFQGCTLFTVLLLLNYLYTDNIITVWDRRIALAISDKYHSLKLDFAKIKSQLALLAGQDMLGLSSLETVLQFTGKRDIPHTMITSMRRMYDLAQNQESGHDTVLLLADQRVYCYSAVLRARSPFFAGLFNDEDWTVRRRGSDGKQPVEVDLQHLSWKYMVYVLQHMCCGTELGLFDNLGFIQSTDDLIDFIFGIIACSNELLIDKLTLLCSSVILRHVTVSNVCSILTDAVYYNAKALLRSLHGYMAQNLETLMESRLLDDLSYDVIKDFASFIRTQQISKAPHIRTGGNLPSLEMKWADWIAVQDFPSPIVPSRNAIARLPATSKLSPPAPITPTRTRTTLSMAPISPHLSEPTIPLNRKRSSLREVDDVFAMDDESEPAATRSSASPWKAKAPPEKTDMKSIIASAQEEQQSRQRSLPKKAADSDTSDVTPAKWTLKRPPLVGDVSETRNSSSVEDSSSMPKRSAPISASIRPNMTSRPSVSTPPRPSDAPWRTEKPQVTTNSTAFPALNAPLPESSRRAGNINKPTVTSPMKRRVSGDAPAWSTPPPPPPVIPSAPTSSSMSFAAIQALQANQQQKSVPKPIKSLKEIQEEEQEIAFLMWFEEEKARIQQANEMALQESIRVTSTDTKSRPKGKSSKGRGKEREQGQTDILAPGQVQGPPKRRRPKKEKPQVVAQT